MSHIVAVAGHPGAGKTSVVLGLAEALGDAAVIHMDSYEKMTRTPMADIARWMDDGADIDAFAFPQLERDLQHLRQGMSIVDPRSKRQVAPCKYILFETQFGRAHSATGRHIDLLLWIETPLDLALARNLKAFVAGFLRARQPHQLEARLRWLQAYLDNYLGTVRSLMTMQKQRVAAGADFVIDGQGDLRSMIRTAGNEIRSRFP